MRFWSCWEVGVFQPFKPNLSLIRRIYQKDLLEEFIYIFPMSYVDLYCDIITKP